MKFIASILTLGASLLVQQGNVAAFSSFTPKSSFGVKSSSALSMNVEVNENAKTVKVGVIGMGRIGLVHLEAITKAPGVVPVIVSNPTVSKAEAAAAQYNIPKFTDDAMDVINDPDVDAVWICSPSQFHADQIKACAAAKKHVFCEKPIATDLAETVEAINACNEAGVKLMIGLQRRFDQNFERVKQAVMEKEVGEPIMVGLLFVLGIFPFLFFLCIILWASSQCSWKRCAVMLRAVLFLYCAVVFLCRSNCAPVTLLLHLLPTSRVAAVSLPIWPSTILI